jgi:peroxiredoxin-like protein
MTTTHEFEASIEWTEAKQGQLSAPGLPDMEVASPPAFGGVEGTWTPEHLFVASANVCLMTTFLAMAEFSKLPLRAYRADAMGRLEKVPGEGFQLTAIDVYPHIDLERASDAERAKRILEKAEASCLISKSMKTPVRASATFEAPGEGKTSGQRSPMRR